MTGNSVQLVVTCEDDQNCSICFDRITQRCLTDLCRHNFCLDCLTQWSKEHNYCPECRQVFKAILSVNHLRYENDFDVCVIENQETKARIQLNSRYVLLRNSLLKEIDRRQQTFNHLKTNIEENQTVIDQIESRVKELESKQNQNNGVLEETINRINSEFECNNWTNLQRIDDSNDSTFDTIPVTQQNVNNTGVIGNQTADNNRQCCLKTAVETVVAYILGFFRFRIRIF